MEQYQGGGIVLNITRCTCWETEEFNKKDLRFDLVFKLTMGYFRKTS